MRVLLDTHVLLWSMADDPRLPDAHREAIAMPATAVLVSAASAWQMSIKAALGKVSFPDDLEGQLTRQGLETVGVDLSDGLLAGALPRHHDDPFDRVLVAQAQRRDLVVATVDRHFDDYDVRLLP